MEEKNMKNPFKYIKHVIKDPITNIDEADARKRELMPLLYTSIGVTVAGVVGSIFLSFLTVLTAIGALGVLLCLFLLFVIKRAKAKFAALTCDGCKKMMEIKTKEDYDKYVTYSLAEFAHSITFSHVTDSNKIGLQKISATGSSSVSVIYTCTCPNCGTKNGIRYRITPFNTEMAEVYKPSLTKKEEIDLETKAVVVSTFRALAAHSRGYGALPVELENKKITAKKALTTNTLTFALSDTDVEQIKDSTAIDLPITSHSIHHADYGKVSTAVASCPSSGKFRSVRLKYHRTVEEMAEGFFVRNELNGDISKV